MNDADDIATDRLTARIAREEIAPLLSPELVVEHRERPLGPHSDELHRVATFCRRVVGAERQLVVVIEPFTEWAIAHQSGRRGDRPELLPGERYATQAAAEHAVFLNRLEAVGERFDIAVPTGAAE